MPTKAKILEHWKDSLSFATNEDKCFKCGEVGYTERAHITSVFSGGDDSVDNLHLLCKGCHSTSEAWEGDKYFLWFNTNGSRGEFMLKLASHFYLGRIKLEGYLYENLVEDLLKTKEKYLSNGKTEIEFKQTVTKYL